MFSIIKWMIIIELLVVCSWPFVRSSVPEQYKTHPLVIAANYVTSPVENAIGVRPGGVPYNQYDKKIVVLDEKIFTNLIEKIKDRHIRAVIYFYDPTKLMHRIGYSQINAIAPALNNTQNATMIPIAVADDQNDLNKFLDYLPRVDTKLVFLKRADLESLQKSVSGAKLSVSEDPTIVFIEINGNQHKENFSMVVYNKIQNFLLSN